MQHSIISFAGLLLFIGGLLLLDSTMNDQGIEMLFSWQAICLRGLTLFFSVYFCFHFVEAFLSHKAYNFLLPIFLPLSCHLLCRKSISEGLQIYLGVFFPLHISVFFAVYPSLRWLKLAQSSHTSLFFSLLQHNFIYSATYIHTSDGCWKAT